MNIIRFLVKYQRHFIHATLALVLLYFFLLFVHLCEISLRGGSALVIYSPNPLPVICSSRGKST